MVWIGFVFVLMGMCGVGCFGGLLFFHVSKPFETPGSFFEFWVVPFFRDVPGQRHLQPRAAFGHPPDPLLVFGGIF